MAKTAPKGRRVIIKSKFGTRVFYSRVKAGTAKHLGLSPEQSLAAGKGNSVRRGGFRAKSYTLHLKTAAEVGGTVVRSLDFPVDSRVRLKEAYVAFRKLDKVGGLTTPDGMSYYWASVAEKAGTNAPGSPQIPNFPALPFNPVEIAENLGIDASLIAGWGFKLLTGT